MSAATEGRVQGLAGVGLILAGVLLVASALAYYLYGAYTHSRREGLIVATPQSDGLLQDLQKDLVQQARPVEPLFTVTAPEAEDEPESYAPASLDSLSVIYDARGFRTQAAPSSSGSALGGQFKPMNWAALSETIEALPSGTRIQIPAIGLDSLMTELRTKWDGNELVWETAVHSVGHHHGTPNPGEKGNSVLSGHISSPVSRQGAVFKRLPEVARLLREGRTVDIVIEAAGDQQWLYRAVSTDVKPPETVNVFRASDVPSLALVTCWPDLYYTERFMVNAVLVGVTPRA